MCGIAAAVSQNPIAEQVLDQLNYLSYRGYDSVGIGTQSNDLIQVWKTSGGVNDLKKLLSKLSLSSRSVIGHTRWATHGAPTAKNAHPHRSKKVAVVHNGIIENADQLRADLMATGVALSSDTDSEVVPFLIEAALDSGMDPIQAIRTATSRLRGQYALSIIIDSHPQSVFAVCQDSPLHIGKNDTGYAVASDLYALAESYPEVRKLNDQEIVEMEPQRIKLITAEDCPSVVVWSTAPDMREDALKDDDSSHLEREIRQQPQCVNDTLVHTKRLFEENQAISRLIAHCDHLQIVACGTSYYAGMIGKNWIEEQLQIPVEVLVASEFGSVQAHLAPKRPAILISQSGETADVLRVAKHIKALGRPLIVITNVEHSSLAAMADHVLTTIAGPEISVASTKAFTTQLTALLSLTLAASAIQSEEDRPNDWAKIHELATQMHQFLRAPTFSDLISAPLESLERLILLGRSSGLTLAREGTLKLQELTYLNCQAFPTGELKHGPLALLDEDSAVLVVALPGDDVDSLLGSVREMSSRGATIYLIADAKTAERCEVFCASVLRMPQIDRLTAPLLYALPLQCLAMDLATRLKTNLDRPRNLAKSVTVL